MSDELRVSEEFLAKYNRQAALYQLPYRTGVERCVWPTTWSAFTKSRISHVRRFVVHAYSFCESLCLFCACNVIIQKDKSLRRRISAF